METSWREARNNGFSLHCCRGGQLNSPAAPLGVLENIWLTSRTIEPGVVDFLFFFFFFFGLRIRDGEFRITLTINGMFLPQAAFVHSIYFGDKGVSIKLQDNDKKRKGNQSLGVISQLLRSSRTSNSDNSGSGARLLNILVLVLS